MGLLDKAKEETNKYVSPKDFLCFLSYKLDEPIKNVVSFLIYNNFGELVDEYYIDEHYRIYSAIKMDYKFKTERLFDEITKEGFFDYCNFCYQFYDDSLQEYEYDYDYEENLSFYEPIEMDFFYNLEELQRLTFIKELNLPLNESVEIDYLIDSDDTVTVSERKGDYDSEYNGNYDTGIKLIYKKASNIKDAKKEQEIIDTYGENSQAHNIYRVIDMASRGELPQQKKEIKSDKQVINELQEQVAQLTAYHNKAQDKIADLENQLAQAKAELADNPADEVELNPKTQTAVTRLLNVLFHKAQLDITAHKGTTNKNIVSSSISLNAKITEKPVSHWIKQVQQLRIDTEKR